MRPCGCLMSRCFNPQSPHPPTDSAADGQGAALHEWRLVKDFIGFAELSTTLFPLKGEVSNHKKYF